MAVTGSGQIKLSDIYDEFTGTHSSQEIQLSDYHDEGNAPASGEIQLAADFYGTSSMPGWLGLRGIQAGGTISGTHGTNQMQYPTVTSSSDTADFGNLTVGRTYAAPACTGGGRMVFGDGSAGSVYAFNMMDYVTAANTGNATDFGDLAANSGGSGGLGVSNGTNAVYGAGFDLNEGVDGGVYRDTDYSYVVIMTTGNSVDMGDLSVGKNWIGSTSGSERGIIFGGATASSGGGTNVMEWLNASTGNSSDFGDLSAVTYDGYSAADDTRAVHFFGHKVISGTTYLQNMIEYVTVASTGNSTDFGDQTTDAITSHGALCNGTYAETWGGYSAGTSHHDQRYRVTVQSTGNASDFADLSVPANTWNSMGTG